MQVGLALLFRRRGKIVSDPFHISPIKWHNAEPVLLIAVKTDFFAGERATHGLHAERRLLRLRFGEPLFCLVCRLWLAHCLTALSIIRLEIEKITDPFTGLLFV